MAFKSATQPLCRYCGQPIKKRTCTVFFGQNREHRTEFSASLTAQPKSREDAQRLVNERIVSISWAYKVREWNEQHLPRQKDYIDKVTTWDGESYQDEFFCNGQHAMAFGYAAAHKGLAMQSYNEAFRAQAPAVAHGA